jgi:SAM-dependent methyltransferase
MDRESARLAVLELAPSSGTVVEVGVWKGDFSTQILRRSPRELHLVDPWAFEPNFPQRLYGGAAAVSQADMDAIFQSVVRRFGGTPAVRIHRQKSVDAAARFEDRSLDWIYVDGNHSRAAVLQDLLAWYPALKPGGYLCLDDFTWRDEQGTLSVRAAALTFLADHEVDEGRQVFDQFVIRKPTT